MAYGDSGNNRGPLVILDLGTTFTNDKAYKISIQNNYKFRISTITPKINPDGSRAWDFKTGISGITISWRDMCRVHLAAQEMLKIYLRRHSGKWDKNDPKQAVFATKSIKIPLTAAISGNMYGDITIGCVPIDNSGDIETFGFSYTTTGKDGNVTKDSFMFPRCDACNGVFEYYDGQNKIHESHASHLDFTDFIYQLESCVKYGKLTYGQFSSGKFSRSGGGDYNGGGGGSSPFVANQSGSQQSFDEDIPF